MKKLVCIFVLFAAAGLGPAGSAEAAPKKAVAGVTDVKGKPTLVIVGSNKAESFQVIKYSSIPEGGNWNDPEVPIWAISTLYADLELSADSSPGVCWQEGPASVYCRRDAPKIKSVIASLGGGDDSFLADKSLRVTVDGGPGGDMIFGGAKDDVLIGGPGRDDLTGDAGDDRLRGGPGSDSLYGDKWRDAVFFRPYSKPAGRDRIDGGAGNDTIQGGAGSDAMIGGPGSDTFENNRDRARDRMAGGRGRDAVHDPDTSRAGNGVAILDRISGFETLYLEFTKYRLR